MELEVLIDQGKSTDFSIFTDRLSPKTKTKNRVPWKTLEFDDRDSRQGSTVDTDF
jgi:hypothetical protein